MPLLRLMAKKENMTGMRERIYKMKGKMLLINSEGGSNLYAWTPCGKFRLHSVEATLNISDAWSDEP